MLEYLSRIEGKEWIVVFATLMGPILAVQAQKWIELIREKRKRKTLVFEQLMATRSARLSPEHVRALNMIDIVFYGSKIFRFLWRTQTEKSVLNNWNIYLDHLCDRDIGNQSPDAWYATGSELLTKLLESMASDLDYTLDRKQLTKGAYTPQAHEDIELELTALRKSALSVFKGETSLKMNVVGFPVDAEALEANKVAIKNIGDAVSRGALRVEVVNKS